MSKSQTKTRRMGYTLFAAGVLSSIFGAAVIFWERVLGHTVPFYYLVAFAPVSVGLIVTAAGLRKIGKAKEM